jgi:MFS family permease
MISYPAIKGKGLAFLILLWSLWFLIMLVRTTFGPILPLIEDEFVISHTKATTLLSLFAFGAAASSLSAGIFAGRFGFKKSVLLCLGSAVAIFLLIPHVRTYSQLAALLLVFGAAWGCYFPCVIPIVTSHFTASVWGRALAIQDTGASLSVLGAPLLTVLMLRFLTWRHFFYVFAVAYAVAGFLFFLFAKEVKVERAQRVQAGGLLKRRSVWILGTIWVFATGSFMGLYQVTPLYFTKELGFSTQYANTLLSLSRIGGVVFGVAMGFVADRFNLKKAMFVILCTAGILTMFIGQKNLTVLQIALFLQGTVIMGFFSIGLVTISRMFRLEERSMASALSGTMGAVFGSGVLPYLFGAAGDHLSFRFGIAVFGAVVLAGSGLVLLLKIPAHDSSHS